MTCNYNSCLLLGSRTAQVNMHSLRTLAKFSSIPCNMLTYFFVIRLDSEVHKRGGFDKKITNQSGAVRRLQAVLQKKLSEFLHSGTYYYIRQIHAAEQSHLYVGPVHEHSATEGSRSNVLADLMSAGSRSHPVKGGTVAGDDDEAYLVYGCLADDAGGAWSEYTTCMQRHWTCPRCDQTMIVTVGQRLEHERQCETEQLERESAEAEQESQEKAVKDREDALRQTYHCADCGQDFRFTTIEIFRHRKTCTATNETTT